LVHSFTIDLKFKDATIDLVNKQNWLNFFSEGLTEYGLSLNANTFDVINDDEGAVSDTESSCDFGREVDVAWGVDEVDQVG